MAEIRIKRLKGKFRISYNGNELHRDKDFDFVKGWLENQVKDFRLMYLEI